MGRRISKEFLHPSILEGVNDKIGNLDSLETDAKGNMVQAINELVEKLDNSAEIENGKELIANAVGEPLTAEESFDEMSNDINSLLSTFKTNMMNNGITVESGDKFKSLIDKIATMVEEGSGKGIQFAEGTVDDSYSFGWGAKSNVKNVPLNLDFTPTYLLVHLTNCSTSGTNGNTGGGSNIVLINGSTANIGGNTSSGYNLSLSVDNITNTSCDVIITCPGNPYIGAYITIHKWYAIGVGEEDTTLRDSLASILENKGVDVTEEDDMASLIGKVEDRTIPRVVRGTTYTVIDDTNATFSLGGGSAVTKTYELTNLPKCKIEELLIIANMNTMYDHSSNGWQFVSPLGTIMKVTQERNGEVIKTILDQTITIYTPNSDYTIGTLEDVKENDVIRFYYKCNSTADYYMSQVNSVKICYNITI